MVLVQGRITSDFSQAENLQRQQKIKSGKVICRNSHSQRDLLDLRGGCRSRRRSSCNGSHVVLGLAELICTVVSTFSAMNQNGNPAKSIEAEVWKNMKRQRIQEPSGISAFWPFSKWGFFRKYFLKKQIWTVSFSPLRWVSKMFRESHVPSTYHQLQPAGACPARTCASALAMPCTSTYQGKPMHHRSPRSQGSAPSPGKCKTYLYRIQGLQNGCELPCLIFISCNLQWDFQHYIHINQKAMQVIFCHSACSTFQNWHGFLTSSRRGFLPPGGGGEDDDLGGVELAISSIHGMKLHANRQVVDHGGRMEGKVRQASCCIWPFSHKWRNKASSDCEQSAISGSPQRRQQLTSNAMGA